MEEAGFEGAALTRGPRQSDGIGIIDHMEPRGVVPSVTNLPLIGCSVPFLK